MRRAILWLLPLVLGAKVLDLEVPYDPFAPAQKIIQKSRRAPLPSKPPASKLHLLAIFGDKAYIDGRFYRVGDRVGGYRIVKIADDYVLLEKKGKMKILFLAKKRILRTGGR